MSENPLMIKIENLYKSYRLYTKPQYRIYDLLGLLKSNKNHYSEHQVLNNINLNIYKGEKVAIIGRNGAGKSTLLKIISGVVQPTSGSTEVYGTARTLLQIGTGFHQDFTGRENVYAYLAQLGHSGKEADQLFEEVIEFSELEEYIEQPVKTYSTGMAARLMFSASIVTVPELLILDEILSVGDAYFTQKSMGRIQELCDNVDTTLILVSHDTYSASKLVDRMIWIDQGEVLIDDIPSIALRAYEDSVRSQEEKRLRKKALLSLKSKDTQTKNNNANILMVEILGENNQAAPGLVYINKIEIYEGDSLLACVEPGVKSPENQDASILETKENCWGNVTTWNSKPCREMLNYGSSHQKVSCYFNINDLKRKIEEKNLNVKVIYSYQSVSSMILQVVYENETLLTNKMPSEANIWHNLSVSFDGAEIKPELTLNTKGNFGSKAVSIERLYIFNDTNEMTHVIEHGKDVTFIMQLNMGSSEVIEDIDIVLSVLKDGVETTCRFYVENFKLPNQLNGKTNFRVKINIPKFKLGIGDYSVVVMLTKSGYIKSEPKIFFSINPDVYQCVRDIAFFKVIGGNFIAAGNPYIVDAKWNLIAEDSVLETYDQDLIDVI